MPDNEIGKRLKKLRLASGKTLEEVGNAVGVGKSTVRKWETGQIANMKRDKISKLAKALNVSPLYIAGFSDEMNKSVDNQNSIRIKVLGSVPAGIPIEAIEDVVDWEDISYSDAEYIGLKIKGDSMFPKYIENDTIIVRIQPDCESGQDAVVYVNGYDATLKKIVKKQDCIILQPLNPNYEPKVYDYNDEFNPIKILGVVVELRRKI